MGLLVLQSYFILVIVKLVIIFASYWVVLKVLVPFVKNDLWHERLKFYLPAIRNVVLFLLILEVVINLGATSPFLTLGIGTGLLFVSWGYSKEVFQGTVFKFQRGNIAGQRLKVKDFSGKITSLNNTKLELETEKGEILQIPYSQIVGDVEVKPTSAKYLRACVLILKTDQDNYVSFEQNIRRAIANLPFIVDSVKPKFEIINQSNVEVECKLVVYTNDEKFIPQIKSKLLAIQG
jgi:hypothetical protein